MIARKVWLPGVTALVLAAVGIMVNRDAFMQSWLVATLTWGMLPLGAIAVLMTHGLTGGRWGDDSRPVWLALVATMPLFVASMFPLFAGMDALFPWTRPTASLPEVVQNKKLYLNEPFFWLRSILYFVLWLGLAWALGAWSTPRGIAKLRAVHAPGLILWVLTITFFGFDWFLSLEPKFYSDVFGLMLCMVAAGSAIAAGILLGFQAVQRDLANLWLAVLLGWAFLAFAQYIVIWSGNLPDEIGWYIHRREGTWRFVSVASFTLFFLLPFLGLLSSAAKGSRRWLKGLAVLCLAGHVLQMAWLVMPAFEQWHATQFWLVPGLIAAVGATYGGVAYQYWLTLTTSYPTGGRTGQRTGKSAPEKGGEHRV